MRETALSPAPATSDPRFLQWVADSIGALALATHSDPTQNAIDETLAGDVVIGGALSVGDEVSLAATDAVNEGAQINWAGAASWPTWKTDVYTDAFRFFTSYSGTGLVEIFNIGAGSTSLGILGKIGVGTLTPFYPLEVHVATDQNFFVFDNGAGTGIGAVNDAHNAYTQFDIDGLTLILNGATGGNVGVGAAGPTARLQLPAGAAAASSAPLKLTSGTNLTTPEAGAQEFDGVQDYFTLDTTSGRGARPVEQYFHLTAAGATISTIANFFGATSNIALVANAYYIIDIYCWFLNTTSGTVVWTLTNAAAPTSQNIYYEMSPVTGIVAPPGTATMLIGQIYNDATAAKALAATGALTDAVNHYMHMRIYLKNGTGTSLKIQATKSAGTITPGINSYWTCRRVSPNNIGTFAA